MFVCKECGSDEVRESAMVDCNTREVIRLMSLRGDDFWCDKCDCEVEITYTIAPDGKKYEVEIHLSGIRAGIWSAEAVGDHNEFDTEAEAWAAIDQLKKIDEEWGSAEYRVVEVKPCHG